MLTNFQTVHSRVAKLHELERMVSTGETEQMIKKEGLKVRRERDKLQRNLGGIRQLERLPDAIFVIDTKKEHIAVKEANRLGIPIVSLLDTNCDPDEVQWGIPANDDAIRAVKLLTSKMADAVIEGRAEAEALAKEEEEANAAYEAYEAYQEGGEASEGYVADPNAEYPAAEYVAPEASYETGEPAAAPVAAE
jgi:small subunit ribosomal protein S2